MLTQHPHEFDVCHFFFFFNFIGKTTDYIKRPTSDKKLDLHVIPKLLNTPSEAELKRGQRRLSVFEACNKLPPGASSMDIDLGGFYHMKVQPQTNLNKNHSSFILTSKPQVLLSNENPSSNSNLSSSPSQHIYIENLSQKHNQTEYKPNLVRPPIGDGILPPHPPPAAKLQASSVVDLCKKVRKSWYEQSSEAVCSRMTSTNLVPNRINRKALHPSLGPSTASVISGINLVSPTSSKLSKNKDKSKLFADWGRSSLISPSDIPSFTRSQSRLCSDGLYFQVDSNLKTKNDTIQNLNSGLNDFDESLSIRVCPLKTQTQQENNPESVANHLKTCLASVSPYSSPLSNLPLMQVTKYSRHRPHSAPPFLYHSDTFHSLYQHMEEIYNPRRLPACETHPVSPPTRHVSGGHTLRGHCSVPITPRDGRPSTSAENLPPVSRLYPSGEIYEPPLLMHQNLIFEDPRLIMKASDSLRETRRQHARRGRGVPLEWASLKRSEGVAFTAEFAAHGAVTNVQAVSAANADSYMRRVSQSSMPLLVAPRSSNGKPSSNSSPPSVADAFALSGLHARTPIYSGSQLGELRGRATPPIHEGSLGILSASLMASTLQKSICTQSDTIDTLLEKRRQLISEKLGDENIMSASGMRRGSMKGDVFGNVSLLSAKYRFNVHKEELRLQNLILGSDRKVTVTRRNLMGGEMLMQEGGTIIGDGRNIVEFQGEKRGMSDVVRTLVGSTSSQAFF